MNDERNIKIICCVTATFLTNVFLTQVPVKARRGLRLLTVVAQLAAF